MGKFDLDTELFMLTRADKEVFMLTVSGLYIVDQKCGFSRECFFCIVFDHY